MREKGAKSDKIAEKSGVKGVDFCVVRWYNRAVKAGENPRKKEVFMYGKRNFTFDIFFFVTQKPISAPIKHYLPELQRGMERLRKKHGAHVKRNGGPPRT